MSLYLDRKYLMIVSSRLRNFKQKNTDLFNFSCNFCGDSKRNTLKARGYMFKSNKFVGLAFKCWNCNVSTDFANFLRFLDVTKYNEYMMEKYQHDPKLPAPPPPPVDVVAPETEKLLEFDDIFKFIKPLNNLPKAHYAVQYIMGRKIPEQFWNEIFYAPQFKQFMDDCYPNHGKKLPEGDDPRIVMFYTNYHGMITNVSGRSLQADPQIRYISVKVSDQRKVFGLHRIDLEQKIYIVEGQFDSLFIPNAIASGDSNLSGLASWMRDTFGVEPVLVFDREPRNKQIVDQIRKAIKGGWDVVLLPEHFPGKDINEAIKSGMTAPMIQMTIDKHTFNGLEAELMLTQWRKC